MFEPRQLSSIIEKQTGGGTPSRSDSSLWGGNIPWASVKDFTDGSLELDSTEESITESGLRASASNLIPAGTPLVCTRMAVGRTAVATMPVAINQDVKALFPSKETDGRYLLRLLASLQARVEAQSVGSTVKGIRIADFLAMKSPIAPANEQKKIAEILDTLDTHIHQTEALIAKLEQIKQGLLTDLLTRGIDANGQLRPTPVQAPQLYKDSQLGLIPKEWEATKIGNRVQLISGQHIPTELCNDKGRGVPYFTGPSDFCNGHTVTSYYTEHPQVMCQSGDLLITVKGSGCGKVALATTDACISRQLMALRFAKSESNFWQTYFLARQNKFQNEAEGGAIPGLGRNHILAVPVAMPIHAEELITIGKRIYSLQHRIAQEQSSLDKLHRQKSGLMDDLLTGRIRVTPLLASATAESARST